MVVPGWLGWGAICRAFQHCRSRTEIMHTNRRKRIIPLGVWYRSKSSVSAASIKAAFLLPTSPFAFAVIDCNLLANGYAQAGTHSNTHCIRIRPLERWKGGLVPYIVSLACVRVRNMWHCGPTVNRIVRVR